MRAHVFEHHIGRCALPCLLLRVALLTQSQLPAQACTSFLPACTHGSGDGLRNGRKAILKSLKGRHIANWYFSLTGPKLPMIVDDVEEE